jgi:hypothetical protein
MKWTAGAIVVCASLASASVAANAANVTDCLRLSKDVNTAIEANADSPKANDARQQRRYGIENCNSGLYAQGVAHYNQALQMLNGTGDAKASPSVNGSGNSKS